MKFKGENSIKLLEYVLDLKNKSKEKIFILIYPYNLQSITTIS
jgi:hypothetical protein